MTKIFLTGIAGFIGSHLAHKLLQSAVSIVGFDNINDYYDPRLKYARLAELGIDGAESLEDGSVIQSSKYPSLRFVKGNLEDKTLIDNLFQTEKFEAVVHLAAQAGVRYSIQNPYAYINSNVMGFMNILEACRHNPVKHLVFASSSSVYGLASKIPFSVQDATDTPVSLYAATKKANELMAHTYSHLYGVPATGLRFFTVYGPWGRPDMAYFSFTKDIIEGKTIDVFNNGNMQRDFTFIDDITDGLQQILAKPPVKEGVPPFAVYNLGNNQPVALGTFIESIENALGKKAEKRFLPMQAGDVVRTWADIDQSTQDFGYQPKEQIQSGIQKFVQWYLQYYKPTL
ncbi:UDP-glucuronate 4-epimerase [Flexibacter flexilis DSM 6793]|uniref:UDP-glucuronate 4-epimerase n=1 Tax=Flexibacter flexilis DSM 6793 TaxID=927664 RepID=A0A1I1N6N4_9BACT|nr:NAD-dependent epimerase [Flexibacter flexilis]SFC91138.1 UDP-glucuronate 4-epimerase [Flexibacter flexilis DSM 6793]